VLSPERTYLAEQLFHQALACPPEKRAAFLDSTCAGDTELRSEVESLLDAESASESRASLPGRIAADWASDYEPSSLIGRDIEQYRVLGLLGTGGMGEVFLAEDRSLGRRVALKLLPARFAADAARLRRFTEEARAASALNHPNIITVHHIGTFEGRRFITTEFIDGGTLRARMARGPLDASEALDIALQVARALDAAHAAGIVHRDIKPENVMIRRDGYVKVLDFGLAKLAPDERLAVARGGPDRAASLTRAGAVLGTPHYMAPEQSAGEAVDVRADLYSLGVVLHEMVTGRVPDQAGANSPAAAADRLRGVSADLARVIRRLLEVDPSARYQTAADLIRDLKALQHSLTGPQGRALRRLAMIAACVATALAATAWLLYTTQTRPAWLLPFFPPASADAVSGAAGGTTLAVLPFHTAGLTENDEFLGLGIADAVISQIGNLPSLGVRPMSSVWAYTQPDVDPVIVGRRLQVDHVLAGLVQRIGDRIRVTVHLVDTDTGIQRWSEGLDGAATDIFSLQDAIARRVASRLTALSTADRDTIAARHTTDPEAYRLYLQGRFQLAKMIRPSVERSAELFQQAIALDERYALAHVGLAYAYRMLGSGLVGPVTPGAETRVREHAQKALALDPTLGEAHMLLGVVQYANDWDWDGAERSLEQAVALSPNSAETRRGYGILLVVTGRLAEGVQELTLARQLDPTSVTMIENLSIGLDYSGRSDEALAALEAASQLEPGNPRPHFRRVLILDRLRQFDEAIRARQEAARLAGRAEEAEFLGELFRTSGYRRVLEYMHRLHEERRELMQAAFVAMALGRHDDALRHLEECYRIRDRVIPFLKVDPAFEPLRNDPRFVGLLRRIGLS
jgi:TolB-like protein/predicted Ser/Thr protein kinase